MTTTALSVSGPFTEIVGEIGSVISLVCCQFTGKVILKGTFIALPVPRTGTLHVIVSLTTYQQNDDIITMAFDYTRSIKLNGTDVKTIR